MKEMGMEKIIFEKDNTLTKHGQTSFFNSEVKEAFKDAKHLFG